MWLSRAVAWRLDPILLRLTGGRFSSTGPVKSAILETTGARTEQLRRTATLYFNDGDRVILVAAKQGSATQPGWYHNLRRHPDVVFGGDPFRAEVVEDEVERKRLWELAVRVYPQYEDFSRWAASAGRQIPIIALVARRDVVRAS